MKHGTTKFLLSMAIATLAQAKIATFDYAGIVTEKGDVKCTGSIQYSVNDDGGAAPYSGSYTVDGCLGGDETYDDGVFTLLIDRDARTSTLTEKSTGLQLTGSEGEHVGPVKPCTSVTCPPATTMTCIFGAGPDGTEPSTKDCGLT
ncbi:hypothetical protein K431DRAFT_293915 [Polychaeton citri CBS 116435]|uniref:Uncharacterized protein n=1 Tax=Polychaeton citri CBS 116435 TaxID=1314669 RepID=A0A9P4Q9N3_9PEZI|nr:hypothetical protein K431DRAFT_293915 [Polychaeton citri CBS 116435]